jgi:hypothetical protein
MIGLGNWVCIVIVTIKSACLNGSKPNKFVLSVDKETYCRHMYLRMIIYRKQIEMIPR